MKSLKRAVAMISIATLGLSIQACTQEDALNTIEAIAIIGGAIAVSSNTHHHNQNNDDNQYDPHQDHGYYPDHGHDGRGDGGFDPNRPHPYGTTYSLSQTSNELKSISIAHISKSSSADAETEAALKVASHYKLSVSSAKKLTRVLTYSLKSKSVQPIYDFGISDADLESIGQMQMISIEGINTLAMQLNITQNKARLVVQQMIDDVQKSKAR